MAATGKLNAVHHRHVGLAHRDVGQSLAQKAAGECLVVDAGLIEETIEGAPVVADETEGQEALGYGALGEGKEMAEDQGLCPKEGAFLAEGWAVGHKQAAEGVQQRSGASRERVGRGAGILRHEFGLRGFRFRVVVVPQP